MKSTNQPFNVKILDIRGNRLDILRPVTDLDIHEGLSDNFHDNGLFSVPIFGRVGSDVRDKRFSYINIRTHVFHPVIYNRLIKLKRLYEGIIHSRDYAVWDDKEKDFVKVDELEGETGYSFFMLHWKKIQFKRTNSVIRDDKIALIEKYKDVALVDKILVLPAGLRDFELDQSGRQKYDEINNHYWKILSIANTLVSSTTDDELVILNNPRFNLQLAFNEIYDKFESLLSGKTGFLQSKWGSRRIFNGTRNVISSMDPSSDYLGSDTQPSFTDTVLGIYQLCKAALPITIHQLKNSIVGEIFVDPRQPIPLIDKKTLQLEYVNVSSDVFDEWSTIDGLEKTINKMAEAQLRHRPLEVAGRYLALIYIGPDNTFRIFNDISELPEDRDIKNVRPLNLVELIYLCGYKRWNSLRGFLTRYPVTGIDSIYPSTIYVKTTIKGKVMYELNNSWEIEDKEHPALEFPTAPYNYLDTLIPHHTRLAGLGADHEIS